MGLWKELKRIILRAGTGTHSSRLLIQYLPPPQPLKIMQLLFLNYLLLITFASLPPPRYEAFGCLIHRWSFFPLILGIEDHVNTIISSSLLCLQAFSANKENHTQPFYVLKSKFLTFVRDESFTTCQTHFYNFFTPTD